ncbi:hypothetical protein SLEP1_g5381 [Rubroshorea leprosula]|uniref:Uncharacterized protein n=1 Tax=Rubroshorea leprosula TaxID=152421 RepID=A0AAV5I0Q2_9ROSI|nr:hypothetical protein SLEP1_g5381 [Rubroshorea leprosula]
MGINSTGILNRASLRTFFSTSNPGSHLLYSLHSNTNRQVATGPALSAVSASFIQASPLITNPCFSKAMIPSKIPN